jgi:hypothetical protein
MTMTRSATAAPPGAPAMATPAANAITKLIPRQERNDLITPIISAYLPHDFFLALQVKTERVGVVRKRRTDGDHSDGGQSVKT